VFNEYWLEVLNPFLASGHQQNFFVISACIIHKQKEKNFANKLRANLKKGRGGYILVMAFGKLLKAVIPPKEILSDYSTEKFFPERGTDVYITNKLYSSETLNYIKSLHPDIIILFSYNGIIRKELIGIPSKGVLSYHYGDMRKYRGQPPGFWELYNGEKEIGVTVQKLSEGIDCGLPVTELKIPLTKKDNMKSIDEKMRTLSPGMMFYAVKNIANTDFKPEIIDKYGKLYTLPNLRQWLLFRFKMLLRY
jgi:folate-dependent phosphoribosylglycinamide formyltransferase PurN